LRFEERSKLEPAIESGKRTRNGHTIEWNKLKIIQGIIQNANPAFTFNEKMYVPMTDTG
jgi:hypothetical protein